jgi:hypothetical protein
MTRGYVKTYVIYVNTSHTFEEGAQIPNWPNGLIIIIIIIILLSVCRLVVHTYMT